jgi:hypothetical protein
MSGTASRTAYREHNNRRNSADGRVITVTDLEKIRSTFFTAYKLVMKVAGTDLDALDLDPIELPIEHLKLD